MIRFFKRRTPPPKTSPGNPGIGHKANIGFSNAERTWEESTNLVDCLAAALREEGYECTTHDHWVELGKLQFQPQIVSFTPREEGGVQTLSTIEVSHPELIKTGLFEYQHSAGDDTNDSFLGGFRGWVATDLPVFVDLEKDEPEICTMLQIDLPATSESPALSRRVLLAPPIRFAQVADDLDEDHPFCPCCLVTQNYDAFEALIGEDNLHGVRLFVMRDPDGNAEADCRVDGVDFEPGIDALQEYAEMWINRGREYRKQYVLMHTTIDWSEDRDFNG